PRRRHTIRAAICQRSAPESRQSRRRDLAASPNSPRKEQPQRSLRCPRGPPPGRSRPRWGRRQRGNQPGQYNGRGVRGEDEGGVGGAALAVKRKKRPYVLRFTFYSSRFFQQPRFKHLTPAELVRAKRDQSRPNQPA